jgi:2-oxo-4-hydroxy-4-carboxy--5-ureidoimidazoline (OHCU) decarboxylase|tara:strand:- start:1597 stop:1731 length:135 start_codon:yes stop_codon:yes gene_type:complete
MTELERFEREALKAAISQLVNEYPKLADKIQKAGGMYEQSILKI